MRKTAFVCLCFATILEAFPIHFRGSFKNAVGDTPYCADLFKPADSLALFYLVGPTQRTAVLAFQSQKPSAFFDGVTLVGLYGYSGDISVDRSVVKNGVKHVVHAEGFVASNLLLALVQLQVFRENGELLCNGEAEYSAFDIKLFK